VSGDYEFRVDVPKHQQIADDLRNQIRSGSLVPRTPLPSEPHLVQIYGVSRDTVRKAVSVLREEGYVRTVKGLGSFVVDRELWPPQ
jgi:DNA-binding GntR family transcriptional regulator